MAFETDCWDVHESMKNQHADFVLLDVRSPQLYAPGHVPGAVNLPHGRIIGRNLEEWVATHSSSSTAPALTANGADKAAVRLARLGRPVKKMIGGVEGWNDEGFDLAVPDGD